MHIKHLFFTLIISNFFTHAHCMQNTMQENTEYNLSHIYALAPEKAWLQIIAYSDTKNKIRATCSYFHDFASIKNTKIFLQNPLVIVPKVLEQFTPYYADSAHNEILNNLLCQAQKQKRNLKKKV